MNDAIKIPFIQLNFLLKIGIYFSFFLLVFSACQSDSNDQNGFVVSVPENPQIIGDATPILLTGKKTIINLEDYFIDPLKIDFISSSSNNLTHTFFLDEKKLELEVKGELEPLSNITLRADGNDYDFLVKKSQRKNIDLKYIVPEGENPKLVQIVGDLNNWNPTKTPMQKNGNTWEVNLALNPGRYPYQIVVDGKWKLDPSNPNKISNGMGGFNSVLEINKPQLNSLPFLYALSEKNGVVKLGFTNKPEGVLVYWNNYKLPSIITDDHILINIPQNANELKRSFLSVYAFNKKGLSNDIKVPLNNGVPIFDTKELVRMDKEAMTMYFPLIDRFNNGNKNNDDPLKDDRLTPIQNYMGGDLKGITQKIKEGYFKDLGINTLWLSPITQNPLKAYQEYPEPRRFYSGYHGYWPISSSKIDHRFGTDEEMHELVKTAHDNGINILLDYVCNHVHEDHPIYKNNPEWATQLNLSNGKKNIRIWDEERLTTWFDNFLPTLDLSKPEVIKLQADSAFYWLKKFNLDGYRHDATKHIPEEFWRYLTKKIKKEIIDSEGRSIYQIGETYGSHELISSYINSGMVDSQFDFNLHFTARDVFAKDDGSLLDIAHAMRETFDYYGYHHVMGNISGNHDQTRFMGLASGAVAYDEDAKEAGYKRKIEVKDKKAYKKLENMHAFLMSVPGVPVIYYGDEIGMVGASDPDNRRMMRFDGWNEEESQLNKKVKELSNARQNSMALMYGDTYMLKSDKNALVYARIYFEEVAIVVFNKNNNNPIEIELPEFLNNKKIKSKFNHAEFSKKENTLTIKLENNNFDYLMN